MEPYLGEIRIFAGTQAPQNWMFCNGQILNVNDYQPLYSLIGNIYGGTAPATFALPDLRGRTPVGQGTGTGLTARTLGQTGGATTVTLTAAQMPQHAHQVMTSTVNGANDTPGNTVVLAGGGASTTLYTKKDPNDTKQTPFAFDPNATSMCGGNLPHDNVMLSRGINYIICVQNGLYPQRP
jgi:microcystin-dependent protein